MAANVFPSAQYRNFNGGVNSGGVIAAANVVILPSLGIAGTDGAPGGWQIHSVNSLGIGEKEVVLAITHPQPISGLIPMVTLGPTGGGGYTCYATCDNAGAGGRSRVVVSTFDAAGNPANAAFSLIVLAAAPATGTDIPYTP